MDTTDPPDTRLTCQEAADAIGCSLRTIYRKFPVGHPARSIGTNRYNGVLLDRDAVLRLVPAPGGDDRE